MEAVYLVLQIHEERYALPCQVVETLATPTRVCAIPDTPDWVRGVADIRGQQTPIVDLRIRLGYPTLDDEVRDFEELMQARQQDHLDWLEALEIAARDGTEFTRARDPDKCKFGIWYNGIQHEEIPIAVRSLLDMFDTPHRAVHAVADEVLGYLEAGRPDRAQAAMERTRSGPLAALMDLFGRVRRAYASAHQGIVIVVRTGGLLVGLLGDRVLGVEALELVEGDAGVLSFIQGGDEALVAGLARRLKDRSLVAVLRTDLVAGERLEPVAPALTE